MSSCVVGLDLSLATHKGSRLGIAICPIDWDCEPRRVIFDELAYVGVPHTDDERGERLYQLSRRILVSVGAKITGDIAAWVIESSPTQGGHRLIHVAELHGAVRAMLARAHGHVLTCPQSAGRKLLLGYTPQGKGMMKKVITETVRSISGWAHLSPDQADAFVVANWGLAELGVPCLSFAK